MVNEAEKYKDEDDKQGKHTSAKNFLESYDFNMKSTMEDDKVKDKVSKQERENIISNVKRSLTGLIIIKQLNRRNSVAISQQENIDRICTRTATLFSFDIQQLHNQ